MKFIEKIKERFFKKDEHSLSVKDEREIAKRNRAAVKEFEKKKNRKNVPEEEYVSKMENDDDIVEFDGLKTYFFTDVGTVKAVDGVTFSIPKKSIVGVVGESGCGKSITS